MRPRLGWLLPLGLLACARPDFAAIHDDCRTRAKAGAGEYVAAYQICLTDRHHLKVELAQHLASAEEAYQEMLRADDRKGRHLYFDLYVPTLQLAGSDGADTAWIHARLRADSSFLRSLDSIIP